MMDQHTSDLSCDQHFLQVPVSVPINYDQWNTPFPEGIIMAQSGRDTDLWRCIRNFWQRYSGPVWTCDMENCDHQTKMCKCMFTNPVNVPEVDVNGTKDANPIDPSSVPRVLRRNSSLDKYQTPMKHHESRVLVLYTGGTIGMTRNQKGALQPTPKALEANIRNQSNLHDELYAKQHFPTTIEAPLVLPDVREKRRVVYTIFEYEPLLDSSNMTMDDWIRIANDLKEAYELFDGFVVLHGTDTLAYTASALSFMLENLGKSVIITGSQIPLFECRSDGRDNLLGALILAGNYCIPEVCVFFAHRLYRGNRTTKVSTGNLPAFDSPNCPPLVSLGIQIQVDYKGIFRPTTIEKFRVHGKLNRNVGLLRIFPSITYQTVRAFLQPPIQGVILQTYGAGNVPSNRSDIMDELKNASNSGIIIVNCTQCSQGAVMTEYETGMALVEAGVIPGSDMTPEAALTKLSYVLAKDEWDIDTKRKMMQANLRGELTIIRRMRLHELELLKAVAQSLQVSTSEEVDYLRDLLAPAMLCAAVIKSDIQLLEAIKEYGADLSSGDYDGRTPLHVASREGNAEIVEYLLLNGASVHAKDRRGNTPLMDAIECDRLDVITLLRNCGAHLTLDPPELASLVNSCVATGNIDRLKSYHKAGVSFNVADETGRTPLHVAVEANKDECIRYLRTCKANVDIPSKLGHTPAQLASALGHLHLVDTLKEPIVVVEEDK